MIIRKAHFDKIMQSFDDMIYHQREEIAYLHAMIERAQSETDHFSHQNRILASRLASVAREGLKPVLAESVEAQEKPKPVKLLGPSLQSVIDSISDPTVRLQIEMEARQMADTGTGEEEIERMLLQGAPLEGLI